MREYFTILPKNTAELPWSKFRSIVSMAEGILSINDAARVLSCYFNALMFYSVE